MEKKSIMLFCSNNVVMFLSANLTPLVSVDLIGEENQVILALKIKDC